ncbi:MAG: chromate transporter [Thermotogaceae bacterium]|nr:chromate transporter [Thermotogaceae bacterium]
MKDKRLLSTLFWTFFKIGSFTFGGGYAMIPLIEREVVDTHHWVSREEILDILAVAQSLPGAIAINSSTLIGYKMAGKTGALISTLGMVLPSFLIILLIAMVFSAFQENEWVRTAFVGIRAAVVGLIAIAGYNMFRAAVKDKIGVGILVVTLVLLFLLDVHPILLLIGGAGFGILLYTLFPEKGRGAR